MRAGALVWAVVWVAAASHTVLAQGAPVRGLYNWIHGTGNAERSFAFYHDLFGVELSRSPFAGPAAAGAPPERIRPAAAAGSDPLVWDLTNTHGSRFRTVFMQAPNTSFGLELSEFFDVPRGERPPNPWDPGAATLVFTVRDLDALVSRLNARGAPVVTRGGGPIDAPGGRAIVVRDPDGGLVEVRQGTAAAVAAAKSPGDVIETSIGISVARLPRALAFYHGLLGLSVGRTRTAAVSELRLHGLAAGRLTQASVSIPGAAPATVVLSEFSLPPGSTPAATPFAWRLQDVGSPQLQLRVSGLDALIAHTKAAGYRFLCVGRVPTQRPFGRFVFAIDPDGVLVEFVDPR
jgi:predicted enzyme related to lactoylglutathione lyase